jgi:hypothetical protein
MKSLPEFLGNPQNGITEKRGRSPGLFLFSGIPALFERKT